MTRTRPARGNYCYSVNVGLDQPLALKPWNTPSIVLRFASKAARKGGTGTANLNGSLLCDAGRTLEDSFSSGCFTTYGLNFDKWGTSITPVCTPGVKCWKDVKCAAYPPSSLPPASYVNNPPPICIAAKNGQVQAFQAGMYNRFEDPANGHGGCSRNNWPTTHAHATSSSSPSTRAATTSRTIRATSRSSSRTTPPSRRRTRPSPSSTSPASTPRAGIRATAPASRRAATATRSRGRAGIRTTTPTPSSAVSPAKIRPTTATCGATSSSSCSPQRPRRATTCAT